MDPTRVFGVVLCIASTTLLILVVERAECTTHPRVKMYGPKVTVIDRRKPEAKAAAVPETVADEAMKMVPPPPDGFPDEPGCLELRLLWRASQRQQQMARSANSIPLAAFDPFVFGAWDEYVKPRYVDRQKSMVFERAAPDRYRIYRQLRPFEKIARLTTTTRAIMHEDRMPRKANLFRLGFPITKIPVISMRLTAKDRFEELKEIMRHEKSKQYRDDDGDNDNDDNDNDDNGNDNDGHGNAFSVVPVAAANASGDAGKKRPVYETLMSRPRHFSQGHYMNVVKPSSGGTGGGSENDVDDDLTPTVLPQYKSSPLVKSWNSRW